MFGEVLREVVLPRGLIDQTGARHRRALLRPLSGWQEAALGAAAETLGARGVSELLAACLDRLGGYLAVEPDHAAALSRGDRARLALELRQLMFGDRVSLSLRCPSPACGVPADLDLTISELLEPAAGTEPEWVEVATPDGTARVRPPCGLDDEACESAEGGRREVAALLWSRLVRLEGRDELDAGAWLALAPATRHAVALALADADSAPDLLFLSRCPTCAAWMELELDPVGLLVRELRLGGDRLLVELHCLAFHYGWSEEQMLALPRHRRWRYLELLKRQAEGAPLLDVWS